MSKTTANKFYTDDNDRQIWENHQGRFVFNSKTKSWEPYAELRAAENIIYQSISNLSPVFKLWMGDKPEHFFNNPGYQFKSLMDGLERSIAAEAVYNYAETTGVSGVIPTGFGVAFMPEETRMTESDVAQWRQDRDDYRQAVAADLVNTDVSDSQRFMGKVSGVLGKEAGNPLNYVPFFAAVKLAAKGGLMVLKRLSVEAWLPRVVPVAQNMGPKALAGVNAVGEGLAKTMQKLPTPVAGGAQNVVSRLDKNKAAIADIIAESGTRTWADSLLTGEKASSWDYSRDLLVRVIMRGVNVKVNQHWEPIANKFENESFKEFGTDLAEGVIDNVGGAITAVALDEGHDYLIK